MNKIFRILSIFFLTISGMILSGCTENEMDRINANTSSPPVSAVDARFQLSDAIMSLGFTTFGGSYAWHAASYTEQIFGDGGAQMTYAELRDPIITAAPTTFNNEWNNTYHNLLSINQIIEKSKNGINAGQTDLLGMAQVLRVLGFQILTELHGDIPFSEALREDIRNPRLDRQKEIYTALLEEIDEAIESLKIAIEKKMANVSSTDLLYKGDVKQWLAFAYAVKARLLLDGSVRLPENIAAALDAAETAITTGFTGADLSVFNGNEADNSWAAYFRSRHYSGACATVVDLMTQRNDPRLAIYSSDLFDTGVLYAPAGDAALSATIDNVGGPLWLKNESASISLLSKASLHFIIAECKSRSGQDAAADFAEGIRASMEDFASNSLSSIESDDVENYISSLGSPARREIAVQKYLSQTRCCQIETYNDLRRYMASGEDFISLRNPNNNSGGMNYWPYSFPYGNSDVVSNPNVTAVFGTGNDAGYYIFATPLWLFSK